MILLICLAVIVLIIVLAAIAIWAVSAAKRSAGSRKAAERIPAVKENVLEKLSAVDLNRAEKLMIVAHPDDETIWGGGHLLQDKGRYLVVCVTAGTDPVRDEELKRAMAVCDAQYLKLGFPDLDSNMKQDRWETAGPDIEASMDIIMSAKKWKLIVTHNPHGEYRHRHHRMLSSFVTSVYKKQGAGSDLYYFGVYYKPRYPAKLKRHPLLPPDVAKEKIDRMIPEYASQMGPRKSYEHMFFYEDWVRHDEWHGAVNRLRCLNIIP